MADRVWNRTGADAKASTGANWVGGVAPGAGDSARFNGTSVLDCDWDAPAGFVGAVVMEAGYTGIVTQSAALAGAAAITITGGQWVQGANTFTRSTMLVNGGQFLGGSSAMNLTGTLTASSGHLRMTSAICTISAGSFNQSGTLTFDHNNGTIDFTGGTAANITGPNCLFKLVTINKSGVNFTVPLGTTCPLGTDPIVDLNNDSTATLIVNGKLTWTNRLTMAQGLLSLSSTGEFEALGSKQLRVVATSSFAAGSVMNGGADDIDLFIEGTAFTMSLTAPGDRFGLCVIDRPNNHLTIPAGTTLDLGTDPTSSVGSNVRILTVNGTLNVSGDWTLEGILVVGATGSIVGTATVFLTEANFTAATGALCVGLTVSMNFGTATGRTFAGGDGTFVGLIRTGTSTGTLTITGTNTFEYIRDNNATAAHTIIFPNVTQPLTGPFPFTVKGTTSKLVTLSRTGAAGVFTLTATHPDAFIDCDFISVSNSTVDADPPTAWYAGANSTIGAACTNWLAGHAPRLGTLATTLGSASLAAEGSEIFTGALAATLEDAELEAEGETLLNVDGELAATLDGATLTGTGAEIFLGSLSATLEDATFEAVGVEEIVGSLVVALEDAALAGLGEVDETEDAPPPINRDGHASAATLAALWAAHRKQREDEEMALILLL